MTNPDSQVGSSPGETVYQPRLQERLLYALLAKWLGLWQLSLNWRVETPGLDIPRLLGDGAVVALWHNRLFMGISFYTKYLMGRQRCVGMVSASRDGARLSLLMRHLRIEPIRGSSSKRARTAAREVFQAVEDGAIAFIAIDGPRGPCYEVQPGAAYLGIRTGKPLLLAGFDAEDCWRLGSWDRFIVPKPFSTVRLRLKEINGDPQLKTSQNTKKVRSQMEADMLQINWMK